MHLKNAFFKCILKMHFKTHLKMHFNRISKSTFQKFLQLEKYSRWKINIQSIFGQHKILYKKIKKNLDFEIF
jgi:hypothetical protein